MQLRDTRSILDCMFPLLVAGLSDAKAKNLKNMAEGTNFEAKWHAAIGRRDNRTIHRVRRLFFGVHPELPECGDLKKLQRFHKLQLRTPPETRSFELRRHVQSLGTRRSTALRKECQHRFFNAEISFIALLLVQLFFVKVLLLVKRASCSFFL